MKTYILLVFTALLLILASPLRAQDVLITYTIEEISPEIHQVKLAARAAHQEPVSLKALNVSFVFDISCAHPTAYQGIFTDAWTSYLENAKVSSGIKLPYRNDLQSARWQFGSADPGLPATTTITLPLEKEAPLPLLTLTFEGTCSQDIYLESQKQNSLNQLADEQMDLLTYEVTHPIQKQAFAFLSLQAEAVDAHRNQIIWSTKNEFDGKHFEIERSGKSDFSTFVRISTEKTANLGEQLSYYQLMDEGEMTNRVFYRLKFVEISGEAIYSSVVEVKRKTEKIAVQLQASVFPNPTTEKLTALIQGKNHQKLQLELSDLNGKLLWNKTLELDAAGFAEVNLDFRSYAQAIYLLEVRDTEFSEKSQSIRIVKQ